MNGSIYISDLIQSLREVCNFCEYFINNPEYCFFISYFSFFFYGLVRFDCKSGEIAHHQSITLAEVENELNTKYKIEKKNLLQRLWHTLQTFSGFPTGDYLLQSDAKQPNCIRVYEKCSDT